MDGGLATSAASIRIVKTSSAVKNISKNSPCGILVPGANLTLKRISGPGISAFITAAAAIDPRIWDIKMNTDRKIGTTPVIHNAKVT